MSLILKFFRARNFSRERANCKFGEFANHHLCRTGANGETDLILLLKWPMKRLLRLLSRNVKKFLFITGVIKVTVVGRNL